MTTPENRSTIQADFWARNYPRLSEAVDRLSVELPGHGYYRVAEQEMSQLYDEAMARGISPEEFLFMCNHAYEWPWQDEETGRSYIETEEGNAVYNHAGQKPQAFFGPGSLPESDLSVELLKRLSQT